MRINKIITSPLNFKGIKVSKPQTPLPERNIESVQQIILDNWLNQLFLYDDRIKNASHPKTSDIDSKIDSEYTSYSPGLFSDLKEKFTKKHDSFQAQNTSLGKKMRCSGEMVKLSGQTSKQLKESYEISLQEETGAISSKNTGIKMIAGYKPELGVLQKEFIDRVKEEKAGSDIDIFGSILFFGPYSNGKTHITEAVAQETGCTIVKIKPRGIAAGRREKAMQEIYKEAEKSEERFIKTGTRTIIFIDEADKLLGENSPITKEFEEFIKSCSEEYHCSVFAATNEPLSLGVNFNAPDIFPVKMSIDPPEGENIEEMFKFGLKQYKTADDIDYKALAQIAAQREEETGGKFSSGQIIAMCDEMAVNSGSAPVEMQIAAEYIQSAEPEITEKLSEKFNNDYKTLIGE